MTRDNQHADLIGLLSGELPTGRRVASLDHIRGCEHCQIQLAETAALVGELKDAGRHSPVDPSEVPPLDLAALKATARVLDRPVIEPSTAMPLRQSSLQTSPGRAARGPRLAALTVVAGLVAGLVGGIIIGRSSQGPRRPVPEVHLAALGQLPTPATGAALMVGSGAAQHMKVTLTGVALPTSRDSVEVWLLDTRTGRTRAIGTMPGTSAPTMSATFPLPVSELAGFNAVDISIQSPADHGQHSHHSVLRGLVS